MVGDIKDRLTFLINEKAKDLELEIVDLNIQSDHVHLFVRSKPIHAPHFIVGQLKGYTSRILRKEFNKLRSRDINIEKAVSDKKETLTYYMFNVPALNSFSKELSCQRNGLRNYRIISERKIETCKNIELNPTLFT